MYKNIFRYLSLILGVVYLYFLLANAMEVRNIIKHGLISQAHWTGKVWKFAQITSYNFRFKTASGKMISLSIASPVSEEQLRNGAQIWVRYLESDPVHSARIVGHEYGSTNIMLIPGLLMILFGAYGIYSSVKQKNTSVFNSISQIRDIFKLNLTLLQKTICGGIITVLVFDALAAMIAGVFKVPYSYATIGTIIVYGSIGYSLSRQYSMPYIVGAAISICMVDILLGTDIALLISPESIPKHNPISIDSYAAWLFNRDTLSVEEMFEIQNTIMGFLLVLSLAGVCANWGAKLQQRKASSR